MTGSSINQRAHLQNVPVQGVQEASVKELLPREVRIRLLGAISNSNLEFEGEILICPYSTLKHVRCVPPLEHFSWVNSRIFIGLLHGAVKKSKTKIKKARTSVSSINNHLGTAVCLILPESLLVDSKW